MVGNVVIETTLAWALVIGFVFSFVGPNEPVVASFCLDRIVCLGQGSGLDDDSSDPTVEQTPGGDDETWWRRWRCIHRDDTIPHNLSFKALSASTEFIKLLLGTWIWGHATVQKKVQGLWLNGPGWGAVVVSNIIHYRVEAEAKAEADEGEDEDKDSGRRWYTSCQTLKKIHLFVWWPGLPWKDGGGGCGIRVGCSYRLVLGGDSSELEGWIDPPASYM